MHQHVEAHALKANEFFAELSQCDYFLCFAHTIEKVKKIKVYEGVKINAGLKETFNFTNISERCFLR